MTGTSVIDWNLARSVAHRVGGKGPTIGRAGAAQAVDELRVGAATAVHIVRDITELTAEAKPDSVRVVDRGRWVDANAAAFANVLEPLTTRMKRDSSSGATAAIGSRVAGAEMGAALGFLSARVLGQYELFTADGVEPQMLLVAPNIVDVEQRLGVRPSDFRLWVCLHEETHRVQFTAVPWLGQWLRDQISSTIDDLAVEPRDLGRRLRQVAAAVVGALRGVDVVKALEQFMSPAEREALDRLTAVMSLLEGHADVVMDAVGSDVIPTIDVLRNRLNQRRTNPRGTEALIRRLLGMEAKLAQYRDGAQFVRSVIDEVGVSGFNRVWDDPESLPSRDELHAPSKWVARVGATS